MHLSKLAQVNMVWLLIEVLTFKNFLNKYYWYEMWRPEIKETANVSRALSPADVSSIY